MSTREYTEEGWLEHQARNTLMKGEKLTFAVTAQLVAMGIDPDELEVECRVQRAHQLRTLNPDL